MSRPKGSKNKKTLEREKQALLSTQEPVTKTHVIDNGLSAVVSVTVPVSSLSEVEAN